MDIATYSDELERKYGSQCTALEDEHMNAAIEQHLDGNSWLSPYLPSPRDALLQAFHFAEVTSADVIVDIGCGDGRVLLIAAKILGCRGIGVDISQECINTATMMAQQEGLDDLVTYHCGDITASDGNMIEAIGLGASSIDGGDEANGGSDDGDSSRATHSPSHESRGTTLLYLYVYPTLIEKLTPIVQRLCDQPGVRAVTLRYHFPDSWSCVKECVEPPMRLYRSACKSSSLPPPDAVDTKAGGCSCKSGDPERETGGKG